MTDEPIEQDPLEVPVGTIFVTSNGEINMAEPSNAFGPVEAADAARQAQFTRSDDSPTDVNNNAVLARSQALTLDVFGKMWSGNADRREKMADAGVGQFKTA